MKLKYGGINANIQKNKEHNLLFLLMTYSQRISYPSMILNYKNLNHSIKTTGKIFVLYLKKYTINCCNNNFSTYLIFMLQHYIYVIGKEARTMEQTACIR